MRAQAVRSKAQGPLRLLPSLSAMVNIAGNGSSVRITPFSDPQNPRTGTGAGGQGLEGSIVKGTMAAPYEEPNAFRSTPMSFVQILMQREAAHDTVHEVRMTPCPSDDAFMTLPSAEAWLLWVCGRRHSGGACLAVSLEPLGAGSSRRWACPGVTTHPTLDAVVW